MNINKDIRGKLDFMLYREAAKSSSICGPTTKRGGGLKAGPLMRLTFFY